MNQNCSNCVFYRAPVNAGPSGMCDYPIPQWLKNGAIGGGFISMPDYSGQDCATFKSRADVVSAEAKED